MWRLDELCKIVGGQLDGDGAIEITGAASIAGASAGDITFVTDEKYVDPFIRSAASAAIVLRGIDVQGKPTIHCDLPEARFAEVVKKFRPPLTRQRIGISPAAHVSSSARIADDVDIHPGAFIGDEVEIGSGTTIYPNATILERCRIGCDTRIFPSCVLYENTVVGDRVILHGGVVLGAYGFGYTTESGAHHLSEQLGNVVVEDDVEIGANTTVDRGTYDSTVIGAGSKLDDLVMVGHNNRIGRHNILCSQVGIAGSCSTGDYVVMAGQVGIGDHINIGSEVVIHAKSGIMQDVPDKQSILGIPAVPIRDKMREIAVQTKLPEMRKELKRLVRQVNELVDVTPADALDSGQEPAEAA